MLRAALLLILILLAACGTDGAAPDVCAPWRAILIADGDRLTDATARDVLAHNETGAQLCGWKGAAP